MEKQIFLEMGIAKQLRGKSKKTTESDQKGEAEIFV
ncbi:hypothetical protein SLEP1_g15284 [Rubroshorea leprosula]|uniref:Uncharacterized protein n=1 Tax=Rubroshorea leprosula TaxID=152421 RepID=A0AAV5ISY3_9ROSI|nr:hypothetical protein SLEP1_g15284 [Rubroshorea leprosula]